MVHIPTGAFTMGSLDGMSDAIPIRTIVSAFYMNVNEVTYSHGRRDAAAWPRSAWQRDPIGKA